MKKFFLIPLMTLVCSVMAWGATDYSYTVGSAAGSDYSNLNAALTNENVYANSKLKAGSNITVTLTSDEKTGDAIAIDMTAATSSNKISVTFDLGGKELKKNIEVTGNGTASRCTVILQNGTFNGSIILKSGGSYLYLKKGTNGLAGTIGLKSESSNKWWNGGAKIEGFDANDVIPASFSLDPGTGSGGIEIPANITVSGNIALANKSSLTITGSHTGAINIVEGWTGGVTLNNTGSMNSSSLAIGAGSLTLKNPYSGAVSFDGGKLYISNAAANYTGAVTFAGNSTLSISAGTYAPSNVGETGAPATYTITGGTMNFNPSEYLAGQYYATDNGNNTWTVSAYQALNVTQNIGYESADFATVYNAASDGDSIKFFANVTISGEMNLTKNLKIDGTSDYAGAITIAAGANVTFDNANAIFYRKINIANDATVAFNAGTYKNIAITNGDVTVNGAQVTVGASATIPAGKSVVLNSGSLLGAGNIFNVAGSLTIAGGTFKASQITASAATADFYMTSGDVTLSNNKGGINATNYSFRDFSITGGTITYTGSGNMYSSAIAFVNNYGVTGNFAIRDVVINCTQSNSQPTHAVYIGGNEDDDAFIDENKTWTISGCTINSEGEGLGLHWGNWNLENNTIVAQKQTVRNTFMNDGVVTISSGSFTTSTENVDVLAYNGANISIPGTSTARFNKNPDPALTPVIYDGGAYEMVESDGWYSIFPLGNVAKVTDASGEHYISSMADILALFPIQHNITIDLLKNFTLTETAALYVDEGYTCTLNLNGHRLAVNGNYVNKLNVNGTLTVNGTVAGSKIVANNGTAFKVNEGGKLTINGGTYETPSNYLNYAKNGGTVLSYLAFGVENLGGEVEINNATFNAGGCALYNAGKMTVKEGTYTSTASSRFGLHSYAVRNAGVMILKDAKVQGIHGAVACETGNGTLEISGCNLIAKKTPNFTGNDAFYALYVCTKAMVSAYDTKFYSENANNTIYIGNNDAYNTFGLIYLYDGCKTNRKMYVQKKKATDDTVLFPVLVSSESDWYKAAMNGGEGPLPANCEYQEINSVIDGLTYNYGVVNTATDTKEVDENATTIPWQQSSTWDATKESSSTADVPAATTVVTIPADKEVVISADPAKNNGVTEAAAEQIFLGTGAKLTVETGTTLTVGEGGVNIANGGQLVVEPGAVVTVGAAGLVTTEEEALVIEYSGENSGVFMIAPEVTENTQPKATVKMYSKAYKIADNNFRWQHFAIPTVGAPEEFTMPVATAVYYLDYNDPTTPWKTIGAVANMNTPFQGYNLTNWAAAPGTEYTFYGNIIGNGDGKMPFVGTGYNFCGNSYTAPIDIALMLQDIKNNPNVDVEPTINIYDTENDRYEPITKASLDAAGWMGTPVTTQIAPMQGFFLNLRTNTSGDIEVINYSNSVWGNPSISTGASLAPKRAAADDSKGIKMIVSANDRQDNVLMLEKAEYSAAFDDDADASKMMSEHSFNLWANIDNAAQSIVATNDLENTILGFQTVEGGEFTISFKANNMDDEYMLLDITTGEKMAIAEGAQYTFTQESNVKNAARFEIVKIAKMPTSIENVETTAKAKGIYTITGQFVGRDYNNLPKGVYVIDGQKIVK